MATSKANIQRLLDERDLLMADMEALKHRIAGLERAIALLKPESKDSARGRRGEKRSVKAIILDLLEQAGTTGLNADAAVEIAERRGIKLHRGSASSTLSRMKMEQVVAYDGKVYRLPKYARSGITLVPPPGGVKTILGSG